MDVIRNYNNFAHNHESFDCSRSRNWEPETETWNANYPKA